MRVLLLLLFTATLHAQIGTSTIEPCGSETIHDQRMHTDSVYAKKMNQFEAAMKRSANRNATTDAVLIIPVVVHIMHKGEAIGVGTNISDQAVYNKLKALNDNYRKTLGTDGYRNGVDTGIEFDLAVRDPNGLCTSGIERIDMTGNAPYMNNGVNYGSTNGISQNNLKAISSWDTSLYYNIYMVSEFDNNNGGNGTQGVADFASGHGLPGDGAVVLANPTSTNTSLGNTETHELGHSLNLYHTFEGDGNFSTICPSATGCGPGVGDCCNDTQPHKRSTFSCNMTGTNDCDNNSLNSLIATNYMNYTVCMDMFTEDQKNRMRNTLTTIRGSFLKENGNMSLMPTGSPTANYSASAQTICAGESIKFYDRSSCIANSYSNTSIDDSISFHWVFTNGATTITSTTQNPVLQFVESGNYTLSYTVTNAFGTHTSTFPNAITVNDSPVVSCTPTSNFIGQSGYSIYNVVFNTISNHTQQGISQGYQDYSCTHNTVVNANSGYYLELMASSYTFLGATLYSAAYIDYNNNATFEPTEKIFEGTLAPGASNYNYTSFVNIPDSAVLNTFLRMRIIGSTTPITDDLMNCNSSYDMGDVEDYGVKIINPLANSDFTKDAIVLFPNPVQDHLSVESPMAIDRIQIYSNVGRLLLDDHYTEKKVTLDVSHFSKGVYFVAAFSEGKQQYFKIIKE